MEKKTLLDSLNECFNNLENKGYIKQFTVQEGYYTNNVYVTFEALETKDFPNGIRENGKYVQFVICGGKIEYNGTGHIWLSEADQQRDKYKYLAMRGMWDIAQENGNIKKFRKCNFKDVQSAFDKMNDYFQNVMKYVNEYTGGYPYDCGVYSKHG